MKISQIALAAKNSRISSESVWPLRGADGLTFAQRRERDKQRQRPERNHS